mmetsp:Transcript_8785/g.22722  ORF Transcript_8785/g.22722 Transcript_8785/m.22722 type:complete len:131 (+) Transcript_8785:281-673(+)
MDCGGMPSALIPPSEVHCGAGGAGTLPATAGGAAVKELLGITNDVWIAIEAVAGAEGAGAVAGYDMPGGFAKNLKGPSCPDMPRSCDVGGEYRCMGSPYEADGNVLVEGIPRPCCVGIDAKVAAPYRAPP